MNLSKLFEMQRQLDERIEREHLRQEGEDRLAKKILALLVELGELANEHRGFKYWSNDQEPRIGGECSCDDGYIDVYMGHGVVEQDICPRCEGMGELPNTLLEEYVDCLHFILSIGLEYSYRYGEWLPINLSLPSELTPIEYKDITKQFNYMFEQVGYFYDCVADCEIACDSETEEQYEQLFRMFIGLGQMLGFTRKQIEEAYMKKNAVNHERQEMGY
ncbi:dUTP diphosphatase [Bacillus alveayuensis]|uniref:dUTP diphosphatase n=1 Tax=Aeribacillus alveayuensis TaxID=279215 RepID=UPI0005D109AF|nr:dUTP diphosphatase [Bacillus alveayuensis]